MSKTSLQSLQLSLAGLACVTWLLPQQAMAAGKSESKASAAAQTAPAIRDIELGMRGRITGQFLDVQGQPKANELVYIQRQNSQPLQEREPMRAADLSWRVRVVGSIRSPRKTRLSCVAAGPRRRLRREPIATFLSCLATE